jgi:hypothetical protein
MIDAILSLQFKSGKQIDIQPYDTVLNNNALSKFGLRNKKFNSYFFEKESVFIGFDDETRSWTHTEVDILKVRKENLERIRNGFRKTNLEPHPSIFNDTLTARDCVEIHRIFTTAFLDLQSSGMITPDLHNNLQDINHGVHEYESTLDTPNIMKLLRHQEHKAPINAGGAFWEDMSSNIYQVDKDYDRSELDDLYDVANVFYYDDCRIGRNFRTAWYMDDDPMASDILDIDSIAPIFRIGNNINTALYSSDEFHNWLSKWNYDHIKPFKDIPFGKIVSDTTHYDIYYDDAVIGMVYK